MSKAPAMKLLKESRKTWAPPPDLLVSEYAEKFRRLAAESSPLPGKWRNDTAPYLVDVMDWLNDPDYHTCVFMKPSRAGATEAGINMKLYKAELDPCHILYVQTSEGEIEKYVKKIFDPAVKATPSAMAVIGDTRTRGENSSTMLLKLFPGGSINFIGGSSPKGFRMVATPFVIGDDIDGMPDDVGGEGDPIDLMISRAKNFWDRKIYLASTTTTKGQSRIDNWFQKSDKRFFYLPCQNKKCRHNKVTTVMGSAGLPDPDRSTGLAMTWRLKGKESHIPGAHGIMKWDKNNPESARIVCEECGFEHKNDRHKRAMLRGGKWRKTAKSNGIAGFHLSRMYSPFIPWTEMVEDWLKAQGKPKELKVFLNHQLAETWEEDDVIELDYEKLYKSRREEYPRNKEGIRLTPNGVLCVTAGIDVQHDRFELEYVGHGLNGETWGLGYHKIPCDTSIQANYEKFLDPMWQHVFELESGIKLRVVAVTIDSGDGARTTQVYKYCRPRYDQGIYAIKGRGGAGIPIVCNPTSQKIKGLSDQGAELSVRLFNVGTDQGKSTLFSHLKIYTVGPGYHHFPNEYSLNYFEMLTAEKGVLRKVKGKMRRVFEQIRDRNEALDIRVYNQAAIEISGADLEQCKQLIDYAILEKTNNNPVRKKKAGKNGLRTVSKGIK